MKHENEVHANAGGTLNESGARGEHLARSTSSSPKTPKKKIHSNTSNELRISQHPNYRRYPAPSTPELNVRRGTSLKLGQKNPPKMHNSSIPSGQSHSTEVATNCGCNEGVGDYASRPRNSGLSVSTSRSKINNSFETCARVERKNVRNGSINIELSKTPRIYCGNTLQDGNNSKTQIYAQKVRYFDHKNSTVSSMRMGPTHQVNTESYPKEQKVRPPRDPSVKKPASCTILTSRATDLTKFAQTEDVNRSNSKRSLPPAQNQPKSRKKGYNYQILPKRIKKLKLKKDASHISIINVPKATFSSSLNTPESVSYLIEFKQGASNEQTRSRISHSSSSAQGNRSPVIFGNSTSGAPPKQPVEPHSSGYGDTLEGSVIGEALQHTSSYCSRDRDALRRSVEPSDLTHGADNYSCSAEVGRHTPSEPLPNMSGMSVVRSQEYLGCLDSRTSFPKSPLMSDVDEFKNASSKLLSKSSEESIARSQEFSNRLKPRTSSPKSPTMLDASGFKNAGSKPLPEISERSAAKAREFLDCSESCTSPLRLPIMLDMDDFKSAGSKPLPKISEESVAKARNFLDRSESCTSPLRLPIILDMDGFKSAGSKPLPKISEESVAKARNFLNHPEPCISPLRSSVMLNMDGFKSAGSRPLPKISEESVAKARNFLDCPEPCISPLKPPVMLNMDGFKSAGSKPLPKISEESVAKARKFLDRPESCISPLKSPVMLNMNGFKSAGSKPLPKISEKSVARAQEFLDHAEPHISYSKPPAMRDMGGFKSAGSKPLPKISEESVVRAQEFLDHIESHTFYSKSPAMRDTSGFKSAGSKPLPKISEESVAIAREFLDRTEPHTSYPKSPPMRNMDGFKSAGSKPLPSILEESVIRTQEFLGCLEPRTPPLKPPTIPDMNGFKNVRLESSPMVSEKFIAEAQGFLNILEPRNPSLKLSTVPDVNSPNNPGLNPLLKISKMSTEKTEGSLGRLDISHSIKHIPPPLSPRNIYTGVDNTSHISEYRLGINASPGSNLCAPNNMDYMQDIPQVQQSVIVRTASPAGVKNCTRGTEPHSKLTQHHESRDRMCSLRPHYLLECELPLDTHEATPDHVPSEDTGGFLQKKLGNAKNVTCNNGETGPKFPADPSFQLCTRHYLKAQTTSASAAYTRKNNFTSLNLLGKSLTSSNLDSDVFNNVEIARRNNWTDLLSPNIRAISLPHATRDRDTHVSTFPPEDRFALPKTPSICKVSDDDVMKAIENLDSSLDTELDLKSFLFDNATLHNAPQSSPKTVKTSRVIHSPKKHQFRTPFKENLSPPPRESSSAQMPTTVYKTSLFNTTVSKPRKTLKDLYLGNIDTQFDRRPTEMGLPNNVESSSTYKFPITLDICGVTERIEWGPSEALVELIKRGANANICTKEWVSNHYKWIVWKLASSYRMYPSIYKERWCHTKVIEQLCYRYETEVNLCRTSILKKISEGDFPPGNHMILCVSRILTRDNEPLIDIEGLRDPLLELTDGWYQLIFIPDEGLQKCINTGKIRVGSKLSICCASLQYPGISMPILESRSRVKLLIAYNSTRIARPWKKLGIQRNSRFSVSIRSIKEKGSVPLINVIIIQKYPLYYYVKGKQLPGTFLSARANDKILQNLILSREETAIDVLSKRNSFDMRSAPLLDIARNAAMEEFPDITSIPVLKLIIRDNRSSANSSIPDSIAELLIWNMDKDTEQSLSKGLCLKIYDLEASGFTRKYESADIQCLSTKRTTVFVPQKAPNASVGHFNDRRSACISCGELKLAIDHLRISEEEEIDIAAVIAVGELRKLEPPRNGFEFERSIILSDYSSRTAFVRVLGVTAADLPFEINAIIELRNVIYKGYDPDFDLYNLGFSFNSCCVYRGKYSGLEHKYPSYSKHMDLDSGSDIKVDLRFSLPPYFYDNLPPRVKDLIGKI